MGWFAGRKMQEPWRGIPELEGVEWTRACDVYERAVGRAWRDWRMWAVLCLGILGYIGLGGLLVYADTFLSGYGGKGLTRDCAEWVQFAVLMVARVAVLIGWNVLYGRMYLAQLRRLVRGELGTHCRGCGYDLRGTPDLRPPSVTRCPECGRVVPRNVHRVVPVPRGSGVGEGVSREV